MTAREYHALQKRHADRERNLDMRTAMIALPLINWGRKEHELKQPEDLFPSLAPKETKPTDPRQHASAFMAWEAAGFGKVTRLNA